MKVKLSFYDKGRQPGDVVEVDEQEFKRLVHDGRVAAVLADDDESGKPEEKKAEAPKNKRGQAPQNKSGE